MSNTFKDVPYWVRLNRDGIYTDHDHTRLGKVYYKRVYHYDENDKPIYVEEPVYARAKDIIAQGSYPAGGYLPHWGYLVRRYYGSVSYYKRGDGAAPEPIMREAHKRVNNGEPDALIEVGTQSFHSYHTVESYRISDHCTEGEKLPQGDRWGTSLPCTPELPAKDSKWWRYASTSARKIEHENYFSATRTRERAHMGKLAKQWNSGEDIEDWDQDENLTSEKKTYIYW